MQEDTPREARKRLFIAIEVPEPVRESALKAQDRLRSCVRDGSVKWVRGEQVHLTLRFLGAVAVGDIVALQGNLQTACQGFSPLALEAAAVGFFPRPKSPRVVWAGIRGDLEALGQLQQRIESQTASFSSEPAEEGRFHAHLTLGRVKRIGRTEADKLLAEAEKMSTESFGRWLVSHVALVQSQLSPKGSIYTVLSTSLLQNDR